VARTGSESVVSSLRRVEQFLNGRCVSVVLEDSAHALLGAPDLPSCSREAMGGRCDLIIAVGGDGNMLGAARAVAPQGVPLLGINRGRLGFLADVSPDAIESEVGAVLDGDYMIEEHFLLEGHVDGADEQVQPSALNEVVIHSATHPSMLDFDLYIDDVFVYNQYSDGLIVSTPTGSTAYSLSAGGPIMHPNIDAMVLVPMFPHTLNSRPLVVQGDSRISIRIGENAASVAKASFDSHFEFQLGAGQTITITKKREKLKLIHPPGHSFYQVCRSKLDWASRVGE